MFGINRDEYTPAEQERHEAAYHRLREMIRPGADAAEFRRGLEDELAAGFAIGFQDEDGWTLLHWAASNYNAIRAGLLQILIDAGADVNVREDDGDTPLRSVCWRYVYNGEPECLQAVETLLAAGARPELDESWKEGWGKPEQLARRGRLEAYIAAWIERRARDRGNDTAPAFDYAM